MTLALEPLDGAELVACDTCGQHLMCAPGHPARLEHHGDGSHTVHIGRPAASTG